MENDEIKVEKGIKMPPRNGGRLGKYPWASMDVGDSFFVPGTTAYKFSGQLTDARKRFGKTFSLRTVDGGVRIWRVK